MFVLSNVVSTHRDVLKEKTQAEIAKKIQESHKLRKESKELLEEAKRIVEEEIEKCGGITLKKQKN